MKKKILSLLVLLAAAVSGAWADEVTIGEGEGTTYMVPTNTLYGFSFTEQIYTASEIGQAGTITAISFYLGQEYADEMESNMEVYMKHVDKETFASNTDIEPVDVTNDKVWEGSFVYTANYKGWLTITLDTPFEYDGTKNLLIGFLETTPGYSTRYFRYTVKTNSGISYYSDSYCPDLTNLSNYQGSKFLRSNRANIKLDIESSGLKLTKAEGAEAHGTIAFTNAAGDEITTAQEGQTVTVTITPAEGYVVNEPSGQWYAAVAAARRTPAQSTDIGLLNDFELTAAGENTWTFTMQRANAEISCTYKKLLSNQDITIENIQEVTYTGKELEPTFVVKDGETPLVKDVDYTVSYANNVNAALATATNAPSFTITAVETSDVYAGDTTITFTILKAAGSISYKDKSLEKVLGDAAFTNELTIVGDGKVTYALSDDEVATVDEKSGQVTIINAPGTFTITATVEDGANYTYETTTASYTVKVGKPIESPFITGGEDAYIVAHKLALITALNKAQAIDQSELTLSSIIKLTKAMENAVKALTNEKPDVEEMDAARLALLKAIDEIEKQTEEEPEVPTAINSVVNGKVADTYDLQGRKVAQPRRGVYVRNGKLVVVK